MPTTGQILADGQLPAIKGTLYTVPAATRTIVRLVSYVHVAGGTQTVGIFLKPSGGTSRKFAQSVLLTDEFAHEEGIETLETGDTIEGVSTDAASVDYLILGVEQT